MFPKMKITDKRSYDIGYIGANIDFPIVICYNT